MIGKGLAEKFKLKVGDTVRVVVPLNGEMEGGGTNFRPKLAKFRVNGILNYGRFDFDSRYMVMNIGAAQELAEIGSRITGYRIKLDDPQRAPQVSDDIQRLGQAYWAKDWFEFNRNLFEAVKLEKAVLFFVLLILVVVACFNVSSTLYMTVVKRFRDISVLKAMGASDRFIRRLFTLLGLAVGLVGAAAGIGLGLLVCLLFEWAQVHLGIIPKEAYKLDHIDLDVRMVDLLMIIAASQVICFFAALVPAHRGVS